MAADLVKTVLDAESEASNQIDDARDEGKRLIEFTGNRAVEYARELRSQAKAKADALIQQAEESAQGEVKKSEKVAELRIRKLISDTEPLYPQAIDAIILHLLNG